MLVNAKLKTVGDRLVTKTLDSVPSSSFYLEPVSPCPCSAWLADDRVSKLHGHAFFPDPQILRDLCPGVDVSVFAQNFKNTTIPSWSQFETQIHASVASLCAALPDHRSMSAQNFRGTLVDTCKHIYDHRVQAFPRTVYGPHVFAQKRKLPCFAVVAVFDKGTSVPNFSCIQLWHEIRRCTLVNSPRFAEVSRFHCRVDAAFWFSWRLVDSLHLSTLGKYSPYSSYHACSPVSLDDAAQAMANKLFSPPSVHTSAITQPLLLRLNRALAATGPVSVDHTNQPYLHPLHSLGILRSTARRAARTMFGGLGRWGPPSALPGAPTSLQEPIPEPQ